MEHTEEIRVEESGVRFGPFAPENFFHMEKSDAYRKLGPGFSTVEFLIVDSRRKFVFVEAKSSAPNPETGEASGFDEFIEEIAVKFQDSYQLFLASVSGRRPSRKIGENVRRFEAASSGIRFVLVIPGHRLEWLPPLSDALKRRLRKTIRMWNIDVAVINGELAREYRLIA